MLYDSQVIIQMINQLSSEDQVKILKIASLLKQIDELVSNLNIPQEKMDELKSQVVVSQKILL